MTAPDPARPRPSLWAVFMGFFMAGLTAYGGPAMMPAIRDRVVGRLGWLSQEEFALGLGLCQALPGGTLMQLAAYIGLNLRGVAGALAAYAGFSGPAFLLITVLATFYTRAQTLPLAVSVFAGLKVVVLAICLVACLDFVRRFAPTRRHQIFTAASAGLFLAGAGVVPIIGGAILGGVLALPPGPQPRSGDNGQGPKTMPLALGLLVLDLALLAGLHAWDRTLFDLAVGMIKVDMLAFGGFGVIPVMFEEAVVRHAWMDGRTFMDGMALAQITPGPTMLASAFVGYWVRGAVGAVTASVSIFAGSFIIILGAAQYRDAIIRSRTARKALSGVLATLGGMIVAVSVSLARAVDWGWPQALLLALALTALARKAPVPLVVLAGAGLSMLLL